MKNSFLQLVFAVVLLVFGGTMEELLPKPFGVGFPVLLITAQYFAATRPIAPALLFAIAAGAMAEALSSLTFFSAVSYFLIVALLMRWADLPRLVTVFTYPACQIWLIIWTSDLNGNIYARFLMALPIGVLTAFVVIPLIMVVEKKVALNEAC